jgi:hypothetical protein
MKYVRFFKQSLHSFSHLRTFVQGSKKEARKETDRLCSDNKTGGRGSQSREIKLKELKHEGHIALGK